MFSCFLLSHLRVFGLAKSAIVGIIGVDGPLKRQPSTGKHFHLGSTRGGPLPRGNPPPLLYGLPSQPPFGGGIGTSYSLFLVLLHDQILSASRDGPLCVALASNVPVLRFCVC